MKHVITGIFIGALAISGAWAQKVPNAKYNALIEDFLQYPNSCNLFMGVDDSGFDGLTRVYAEKLVQILNNDEMTPRESYAAIYQTCATRHTASAKVDDTKKIAN
ncbi:hypothetical protein PSQ20_06755 [Curvibacter sp. RS43]|uniref:hypothetical protein n=1 Tax=Curvibacter microcysteis TaxID=3026419 RepID=UPI0023611400|nr:hypothetical protein [Curvibacter sp. RS43]MDD0810029.1 hypothetical protein [Curvibacter sp. RS43]